MNIEKYREILEELRPYQARLVAVSKTKPVEDILQLYHQGQRIFGENKVQEMAAKQKLLPQDIQWHLIGHLQTNKVKYIAPFVALIHSADSLKLLQEIDRQAQKCHRVIDCLLQIHIAREEEKFGFDYDDVISLLSSGETDRLQHVRICGLMGMATFTDSNHVIEKEFQSLKQLFDEIKEKYFPDKPWFREISMGMSSDYPLALRNGATLIRVGSSIFGGR